MIRNISRKKVLVLCPFPPVPNTNGGSERTSVLYSNLNACADVLMIWPEEGKWDGMAIVPGGALQISLAIEKETQERISAYRSRWGSIGWGAALGLYIGESALFKETVSLYAKDVDVIVLSHPWLVDAIPLDFCGEVIYDAHNYEKELIRSLVADLPSNNSKHWLGVFHKELIEDINAIEDRAIIRSNSIICVSDYDQSLFQTDYPDRTFKLIPSGFSPPTFESLASRKSNQVLFFGSNHPPNIRAVEQIFFYATLLPEVEFIVAGSVCNYIGTRASNVYLVGQVSEEELVNLLASSSLFINPIASGAGISLKVMRAMASGIPVLSTRLGARGLLGSDQTTMVISDLENFPKVIREILDKPEVIKKVGVDAKEFMFENFEWEKLSQKFNSFIISEEFTNSNFFSASDFTSYDCLQWYSNGRFPNPQKLDVPLNFPPHSHTFLRKWLKRLVPKRFHHLLGVVYRFFNRSK